MSQNGTPTQMMFINWGKKLSQRMEGKWRDRRSTYHEVYPEIRDIGGIEVEASSEPFRTVIHLRQSPLHAFPKSKRSGHSLTLRKVQQ